MKQLRGLIENLRAAAARRKLVWIAGILGGLISILGLIMLMIFMANDSTVRPAQTGYWEFWLPWLLALGNILYFAVWATLTTYAAEEQALIRRVQFHPILETRFIKSVDIIGEAIVDEPTIPDEYSNLTTGQSAPSSNPIELRYLILLLKNRGQGIIDTVQFGAEISVPATGYRKVLNFNEQVQLAHAEQKAYLLAPIWNFPRYEVSLKNLQYSDFFGSYNRAAGRQRIAEQRPYGVPESRKKLIFFDDFIDQPVGRGWMIDYWGKRVPSELMCIEHTADRHVLVFRGAAEDWDKVLGNKDQQSGAHIDFVNLPPEVTYEISARVRSVPDTTGKFKIWCHDMNWLTESKTRDTGDLTPPSGNDFTTVSMFYTTTSSSRLRTHLHYVPGAGAIEIDSVTLRQLEQ